MSEPVRVQRKRVKGFDLQAASPNELPVVSVTRPGDWGNRFKVGIHFTKLTPDWRVWSYGDRAFGKETVRDLDHSLELFADYAAARVTWDSDWLKPLKGKNLACWCALGSPCHADILLRLANK